MICGRGSLPSVRRIISRRVKVHCPKCRRQLPLQDVNVSTDTALCRACSERFSLVTLLNDQETPDADLTRPPSGAWLRQTGSGFELGATTRSGAAFILVPFTLFWSGVSLGGIYGTQIYKGEFDWKLCLFGLPFLAGSAFLIPAALMAIFGRVRVRSEGDRGEVFAGIGPLGWRRRFRWNEIQAVRRAQTKWQQNRRHLPLIELVREPKPVRFGSQLSAPRQDFMLAALKRLLDARTGR